MLQKGQISDSCSKSWLVNLYPSLAAIHTCKHVICMHKTIVHNPDLSWMCIYVYSAWPVFINNASKIHVYTSIKAGLVPRF